MMHIRDEAIIDAQQLYIDTAKLDLVGRMEGILYTGVPMTELNHTHDPTARSWIASANSAGCDFPIQTLPLSISRRAGSVGNVRGGVAIGDQLLDLGDLSQLGHLGGLARDALGACRQAQLNDFFAMGAPA